jgi:hypothetical protein
VSGSPVLPEGGVSLEPGEGHCVIAVRSLADPLYVKGVVEWIDESSQRQREVYVS